jgi:hypothetical protein
LLTLVACCLSALLLLLCCATVPDRKQKGVLQPASRSPEVLLVKELTAALQANEDVAAACLKLQAQLQGEGQCSTASCHGSLLALSCCIAFAPAPKSARAWPAAANTCDSPGHVWDLHWTCARSLQQVTIFWFVD